MAYERPTLGELEGRRPQMFPALSDAQLARVKRHGTERRFATGEIVFEQGETGTPLYVVLDGEMDIVHPYGRFEELVTVHRKGEFTGELTQISDGRALVRGRARSPLRVLRVENAAFRALLQTDGDLSEVLMRAFILRRVGLISAGQGDAILIGSHDSAATARLRSFLVQSGHPHRYVEVDRDADVQSLLDEFGVGVSDVPILICRGERVLRNPSNAQAAECLGFSAAISPEVVHDVVVCGAGPAGLATAVYGASEGLDVLVLDAGAPGGQAASSSKIENYLGFPTGVSGAALAGRGFAQPEKFGPRIATARAALRMRCEQTTIRVELDGGASVRARVVVVATGAQYRKLDVPGLSRFEGVGVYYAATYLEAQRCGPDEIIVVGGGNSAGQAATFLARGCHRVHVLIRGPNLAASMSRYLIRRIEETPNITLHRRTRIVALDGDGHLERVTWRDDARGETVTRPIRHVFTMAGAAPNTAWLSECVSLDEKGFVRTGADLTAGILQSVGWSLERGPYLFETSRPRVFAVGDVRANSVKRVASAVGEGSVCIQLVHRALGE